MQLIKPNPAYLIKSRETLDNAKRVEQQYTRASDSLGSAGASDDFSEIQDVDLFVNQQMLCFSLKEYNSGDTYNLQRLNSTNTQLDRLRQISNNLQLSNNLQQEISAARSPGMPVENLIFTANSMIVEVKNILNTTFVDESLFSGTTTATPAVGLLNNPGVTTGGIVTKGYYLGNFETITFNADSATQINIDANAGSDGIAQLVYAINLCIYAGGDPNLMDRLGYANDLCFQASQNIINDGATLQTQMKNLTVAKEGLLTQEANAEVAIQSAGYETPSEALQKFINAKTLMEVGQSMIIQNEFLRDLVHTLNR